MKRVWGSMVIAVLVIALALSFAACGNANASKLEELDGLVSQYEGIVADAQAQVDVLTGYVEQYEIEGFDEKYAQIVATVEEIAAQKDDIVGSYNENRDSYSGDKLDELIGIMNTQIENGNTFLESLKNNVSQVEETINGAQE
jgi:predicted  nucleic acid-binding Zn-ribbon protein